jgi:predicted RNase H-like HicB family nuclease
MKKWKGVICFPLFQEVVIEAETEDEARDKLSDACDVNKASYGDPYVYGFEQMEGE